MFLRCGSLVALLVLSSTASAKPGANDLVKDKELLPYRKELFSLLKQVQERKRPIEQVMAELKRKAEKAQDKRKAAIRHFIYGTALMDHIQRNKDAEVEFKTALELHPKFPPAVARLAQIARISRDKRRTYKLIQDALQLDPKYTKALTFLGSLYLEDKRYPEALTIFGRSFDIDMQAGSCYGLSQTCRALYRTTYNEKERAEHANLAVQYADIFLTLANSGEAHLFRAEMRVRVGRLKQAIKVLEESCHSSIPENYKVQCLDLIFQLHARMGHRKSAIKVLERMLEHEQIVKGELREQVAKKIEDLKSKGDWAYRIWRIEQIMEVVANPGTPEIERRDAIRTLLGFYTDRNVLKAQELTKLRDEVFRAIMRTLKNAAPKVSIEVLRYFQDNFKSPRLIRILVHFIYPRDDRTRTPEVRVEAVRTIAMLGAKAALPTLYYCLRDEPGDVLREVERHLASICQVRSKVSGGLEALTPEQKKTARTEWRRYFTGEEGAETLKESLAELRKWVDMDPGFNRSSTKPLADHVAWTILLDDDMPFETWKEAYEFLRDYIAKEFRPVARRGKPVEPAERPAIVKEIEAFMGGRGMVMDTPQKPEQSQKGR